ncbi:MAG: tRNA (adenosine(37)-N6)-threonylcarbamoyltransferase complex dimerization subunit type 1 TsaB [Chitinophagales bacterium]|nr:tRNA (adenosine(37)-N6)-threonylcarbamoyltransferase complex dimerization subunit type 1 TsaB [Chitinophagales bacterium]
MNPSAFSKVLYIDSAYSLLYIGLKINDKEFCKIAPEPLQHGLLVNNYIEDILAENNVRIKDIDLILLNRGPGSFTGLRIGSSLTKGLAWPHNIPIIAFDGLQIYAKAMCKLLNQKELLLTLDARRGNVFFSYANEDTMLPSGFEALDRLTQLYSSAKQVGINEDFCREFLNIRWIWPYLSEKAFSGSFDAITSFKPNYIVHGYNSNLS